MKGECVPRSRRRRTEFGEELPKHMSMRKHAMWYYNDWWDPWWWPCGRWSEMRSWKTYRRTQWRESQ